MNGIPGSSLRGVQYGQEVYSGRLSRKLGKTRRGPWAPAGPRRIDEWAVIVVAAALAALACFTAFGRLRIELRPWKFEEDEWKEGDL